MVSRGPIVCREECHKGYYRKLWTFQTRFSVENPFGVTIFRIFWFQKVAIIMVENLVKKKFSYLKVGPIWRHLAQYLGYRTQPHLTIVEYPTHPYRFYKGQNRYPLKTWLKISQKIPKNHQKSEKIQKIGKSKNCPKKSQKTLHYAEIAFFPIFAVFCQ